MADLEHLARASPKNATRAERLLWLRLRRNSVEGFYFRRQIPLLDCIADFACFEAKLIVEVDGATHSSPSELAADARRYAKFEAGGFAVLRVVNDDLYKNLDGVLENIRLKLRASRLRVEDPHKQCLAKCSNTTWVQRGYAGGPQRKTPFPWPGRAFFKSLATRGARGRLT